MKNKRNILFVGTKEYNTPIKFKRAKNFISPTVTATRPQTFLEVELLDLTRGELELKLKKYEKHVCQGMITRHRRF